MDQLQRRGQHPRRHSLVTVSYGNDTKTSSCDRNLLADSLTFVGGSSGGGGDTTPPAAPTGLSATAGDANVQLSWAGNTEPDLAGYNVYRSTTTGGPYSKVNANLVTSPSYVDGGRTNGTKYFYVVRAVDTSTNESGNSNEANATPTAAQDTTPPAAPRNLAATPGRHHRLARLDRQHGDRPGGLQRLPLDHDRRPVHEDQHVAGRRPVVQRHRPDQRDQVLLRGPGGRHVDEPERQLERGQRHPGRRGGGGGGGGGGAAR